MEADDFELKPAYAGARLGASYESLNPGEAIGLGYRWWFLLLLLFLASLVIAAAALGLTVENTNKDNLFRDTILAQLPLSPPSPLVIPCDQLSASVAYQIFHQSLFSKAFEGIDGSDCFPFSAFGAETVCVQVDSTADPSGTADVAVWKANDASGIGVPGHEHDCADETWIVVSGSCAWWWDSSDTTYSDFMGVQWANFQTVSAPGMAYKSRGTVFSWACEAGSVVYTIFTPGNVNGLVKALAVDVFGPSPTLPVARSTVVGLGHAHCTVFRPEALDVVFP